MWFGFPEGCSSISIERQEFFTEVVGEDNRAYFRAPDHFAPRILMLNGFVVADPTNLPEDLPQADPLRDGAIAQLTGESVAQRAEIRTLREDLAVATGRLSALANENATLTATLAAKDSEIARLTESLEDK